LKHMKIWSSQPRGAYASVIPLLSFGEIPENSAATVIRKPYGIFDLKRTRCRLSFLFDQVRPSHSQSKN
jgi:hypothetical protein